MLNLGSSLLYALCVFCFVAFRLNAAFTTYEAKRDEYFDVTAVQSVKTRSAIECCALCDQDDACETINYNREDSECELIAQRPQLRDDFITRLNWTFYMKPVCCDEDWVHFDQSLYLYVMEKMDWYHADGHCMALGAELVDIHSTEEQTFVYNYHTSNSGGFLWIGLNDIAEEGSFRWSSGRPTTYTTYVTGEPDGGRSQNCIVIYASNMWIDISCTSSYSFICEKSTI